MTANHPKIQEQIHRHIRDFSQIVHELEILDRFCDEHQVAELLNYALEFACSEDQITIYQDGRSTAQRANRHWITLYFHAADKTDLRPYINNLLQDLDLHFEKSYHVDNWTVHNVPPPVLAESWTARWDRIDNPHGCDAWNQLTLFFLSTTQIGRKLSDTCCIELVDNVTERHREQRAAVVCHKNAA